MYETKENTDASGVVAIIKNLRKKPKEAASVLEKNKNKFIGRKVRYRESRPEVRKIGILDNIKKQGNSIQFFWHIEGKSESRYSPMEFHTTDLNIKVSDGSILFRVKGVGAFGGEFTIYA